MQRIRNGLTVVVVTFLLSFLAGCGQPVTHPPDVTRIRGDIVFEGDVYLNNNSNAFNIKFLDSEIRHADMLVRMASGSIDLENVDLFDWDTRAVLIDSTVQGFIWDKVYTEGTTGVFILQFAGAGVATDRPMVFRNCVIAADATWSFSCQQPVTLEGCSFAGSVTVDTPGAYATEYVTSIGNTFASGKGFSLTDTGGVGGGKLVGFGVSMSSAHDYAAGTTAWTITASEATASLFTVTSAGGAADAVFPVAVPGKQFTVYNNSGAAITFKVTGQTGAATTNGKYSIWTMNATDCVLIYEQP